MQRSRNSGFLQILKGGYIGGTDEVELQNNEVEPLLPTGMKKKDGSNRQNSQSDKTVQPLLPPIFLPSK